MLLYVTIPQNRVSKYIQQKQTGSINVLRPKNKGQYYVSLDNWWIQKGLEWPNCKFSSCLCPHVEGTLSKGTNYSSCLSLNGFFYFSVKPAHHPGSFSLPTAPCLLFQGSDEKGDALTLQDHCLGTWGTGGRKGPLGKSRISNSNSANFCLLLGLM